MEQPGILQHIRRLGAQRRMREILLAVLLTIAAFAFLATAIFGRDASPDGSLDASVKGESHYETAGKPAPQ